MSSVDNRVVNMQFNNSQFESGIQESLSSLEKLKKGLGNLADGGALSGIASGVEAISGKFSALGIMGVEALKRISNAAIDAGEKMIKSLTTEPITTGFKKYEDKTKSVQTIMAATGLSVEAVNDQLAKLNWFTDETSYNFVDMVNNIGKFTSAGVELDTAVTAMQGIANWAAISGQGTNEASRAMYNLAQSIGMGVVKLQDWKSIENANMATKEFKEIVVETAKAVGTLDKDATVSFENFSSTLSDGWFTSDVLLKSLDRYGNYANEVYEISQKMGITCSEAMELVDATGMELGEKSFKAAQEAKTLTDAIEAVKDAVSTGWMTSFEIIIGDYEEARVLWTDVANALWEVFASGAEARNEFLELWKAIGGRESLIQSFRNIFEGFASVAEPIKEAFSEIFKPLKAGELLDITKAFETFTEKIKIGEETADKLKRTFAGLFSVLDIVKEAVGAVFNVFRDLVVAVLPAGDGLLGFTAKIGDFLVGVRDAVKEGDLFNAAFSKIRDVIVGIVNGIKADLAGFKETAIFQVLQGAVETAAEKIKAAFDKIKAVFGGWAGIDLGGLNSFSNGTQAAFRPFTMIGNALSKAFEFIKGVFEKVAPVIKTVAGVIINALKELGAALGSAFKIDGLKGVLDVVNTLLAGGILVSIWKFVDKMKDLFKNADEILESVKGIFDGLKDSINNFNNSIKAKTLMTIAGAIAMLTASLVVLSLLDEDKLKTSLMAITVLFAELAGTMIILQKSLGKAQMVNISGQFVAMAAAVLLLANAVKVLASVDPDEMMRGLAGIGVIMLEIVAFTKLVDPSKLSGIGIAMVLIGASMTIFASAVKSMGSIDSNALLQGLGGIGAILLEIAAFTKLVNPAQLNGVGTAMLLIGASMLIFSSAIKSIGSIDSGKLLQGLGGIGAILLEIAAFAHLIEPNGLIKTGGAMLLIGAALLIFSSAIKSLGSIDSNTLLQGLGGVGAILLEIAAFVHLIEPNGLIKTGAAMVIIGAALLIFANAVKTMGSIDVGDLVKGVGAVGVILLEIAGFSKIVDPDGLLKTGAAMVVIAAAMVIFSNAVKTMGGMGTGDLVEGVVAIGAILLEVAGFTKLVDPMKLLAAAAAMVVMGGAMLIFSQALQALGSMSLAEVGVALLALAGIFVIVGVAGLVLAPLTPVILALSAAIAVLGVGVLAICAGLLLFSEALNILADLGPKAVMALALIPQMFAKIGEGIIELVKVVTKGIPEIMKLIKALAEGLVLVFIDVAPSLAAAMIVCIKSLLDSLEDAIPDMVNSGMKLLVGLCRGIADNIGELTVAGLSIITNILQGLADGIPELAKSATDVIVAFLEALGEELPRVVDAGFKMVIDLANGIADAIRENTQDLLDAGNNIASAIIDGMLDGIAKGIYDVGAAAMDLGRSALDGIKNFLGIRSPSEEFRKQVGMMIPLGMAEGIKDNSKAPIMATNDMAMEVMAVLGNNSAMMEAAKKAGLNIPEAMAEGIANQSFAATEAARKAADNTYNNLKQSIYEYRKDTNYIIEEEIKMWDILAEKYEEGSAKRLDIEKELTDLTKKTSEQRAKEAAEEEKRAAEAKARAEEAAKARKELFNDLKQDIADRKALNELSTQEEIEAWERVAERYKEGTDERKEADKELYNARKKLRKEEFDEEKKWLENKKNLEEISMRQEIEFWEDMQARYIEGTDERKQADKEAFEAKKRLLEEEEKLTQKIQDAEDKYAKTLEDRTKSIANSFGLFAQLRDEEAEKNKTDEEKAKDQEKQAGYGKELSRNLQDQVIELRDWAKNIDSLAKKGIDEGLLDELRAMGPSANKEMAALNRMTSKELDAYVKLWKEKMALARKAAEKELTDELKEKNDEITKANEELERIKFTDKKAGVEIEADVDSAEQAGKDTVKAVVSGIKITEKEAVKQTEKLNTSIKDEFDAWKPKYTKTGEELILALLDGAKAKKTDIVSAMGDIMRGAIVKICSYKQQFRAAGADAIKGFIDGLSGKIDDVAGAASDAAGAAYGAVTDKLGIKSPSKEFAKLGKFSMLGFSGGIEAYSYAAREAAENTGDGILDRFKDAIRQIGEVLTGDIDMSPTITPVFDFSEVKSGLSDLDSLFQTHKTFDVAATGIARDIQDTRAQGYSGDVNINIRVDNPVIREEHDIKKLADSISMELAKKQMNVNTSRGLGRMRLT